MRWLWTAPADNERGPRYMEQALGAIHQSLRHGECVSLSYATADDSTGLYVACDDECAARVYNPLIATYPQCTLTAAPKSSESVGFVRRLSGVLSPDIFPLLRHPQFEDQLTRTYADPIENVLRAVRPDPDIIFRAEWLITPARHGRVHAARITVDLLDRPFFRRHLRGSECVQVLSMIYSMRWVLRVLAWCAHRSPHPTHSMTETTTSRLHEREEILQAAAAKVGGHLYEVQMVLTATASADRRLDADDRLRQIAGAIGAFTVSRMATFQWSERSDEFYPIFLLSAEEIATLFHPPTSSVTAEGLQTRGFTELEPPAAFPADDTGTTLLGRARFRSDNRPIRLTRDAKRRHIYMVGATGTGKSTLLLNLMSQDLEAGGGLTVIDMHGDLADGLLQLVPSHRTNDVIVFDPAGENAIPFNPLACSDPDRRDQVVSGIVSGFRKLYDSWGPRLENLLRFAVFAVVERQGTLLDVLQLLTDAQVRDRIVPRIEDEVVQGFFEHEFKSWSAQYRTEAVSSVTNKILPFLTNSRLREIVTSRRRGLDIRQVMDRGQVLVINLSRGKLGQDNATLLGSLLLTAIEQAALSRADLPEAERLDHSLYLDEFQTLVTPSTSIMLSESRKYRLNLTLSHQLTRQLDEDTRQAVLGNCGSFVSFRVGAEDAELLAPAFSRFPGQLSSASLMGLPNYVCYVRMLLPGGTPSAPFSLQTLPPPEILDDRSGIVRRTSMRRFHA